MTAVVRAEFCFKPKNFLTRWLAWLIGAQTWGILRTPPDPETDPPDVPYGAAVVFVVGPKGSTELKALGSRPATHAEKREGMRLLARMGYFPWFERRYADWSHRKNVVVPNPAKIENQMREAWQTIEEEKL